MTYAEVILPLPLYSTFTYSIPDNLLIDPQGKIVARGLRAQGLQNKLKEIFGE